MAIQTTGVVTSPMKFFLKSGHYLSLITFNRISIGISRLMAGEVPNLWQIIIHLPEGKGTGELKFIYTSGNNNSFYPDMVS
jgi:hypothetical protein